MSEIRVRRKVTDSLSPVSDSNALPVEVVTPVATASKTPYSIQTGLSIAASSTALLVPTSSLPAGAIIQVFSGPIRYWAHGGAAPTATTGHRADINDIIILESLQEVNQFRAIRETSVSATLEVAFVR